MRMTECSIRRLGPFPTRRCDRVSLGRFVTGATGSMEGMIDESRRMSDSWTAPGDPS